MNADSYSKLTLILISVIITLYMLVDGITGDSVSKLATFSMLLLLLFAMVTGKFSELPKTAVNSIAISISAYFVIYTISLFYATTGQFALGVYSYYLGGIIVFFLTVMLVNRESSNTRTLLSLLACSTALSGIFSIDSASLGWLSGVLRNVLSALLKNDSLTLGGFEAGTRMTSILENPNVFASLTALGTFSAAYLFLSAQSKRQKHLSTGLLIVNAVSFLYCFSLGAMMGMFFSVVTFIASAGKEERSRVVYVILTTIAASFLSVFAGFSGMGKSGAIALLPLLSLLVFGFALFFLLRYMDSFTAKTASWGKRRIVILLVILVLLFSAGAGAAVSLSDSFTFQPGSGSLRRAVSLEPGDYELALSMSKEEGKAALLIESQNYGQASTHTSTVLYQGAPESSTSFTVPMDSNITFIEISAPNGTVVDRIAVTDEKGSIIKNVKPDYLLLPSFMANRLQGLLVNQNAAQRLVFFQDGLKIAAMSPIIGHGPGAFESKVLEVQDYYYETKTPHNHYIQTLDDTGVLGLLAFAAIMFFSAAALIRKAHSAENRALYSSLSAMLVMMIIHSAVEVTFFSGVYNMVAYLILGLISIHYGQKVEKTSPVVESAAGGTAASAGKGKPAAKGAENPRKKAVYATATDVVPSAVLRSALALFLIPLLIFIGQFAGQNTVKGAGAGGSTEKFMNSLKTGTILDFTNDNSYKSSFIITYTPEMPETYKATAEQYAQDLVDHNSFSSLSYAVSYYLKTNQLEKTYQIVNHRQSLLRYDKDAWNETFDFYREHMELATKANATPELALIKKYASAAYDQLKAYLETSPLDIKLSDENQGFVVGL